MTYASANRRPNPAALVGALGIPGAFGALLMVGLAVTVTVVPDTPNPQGRDIPTVPLPPPPDPLEPASPTNPTTPTTTILPPPPPSGGLLPVDLGQGPAVSTLPGTGDLVGPIGPVDFGIPGPTPSASPFDPVGATPRGKPGNWVTNADYRSRWIREGLTGSAGFRLTIDAAGKVTGCTITRSTGHAPLDEATCELVTKRARFDAARDGNGKPVAGTYSNTVNWNIPD